MRKGSALMGGRELAERLLLSTSVEERQFTLATTHELRDTFQAGRRH